MRVLLSFENWQVEKFVTQEVQEQTEGSSTPLELGRLRPYISQAYTTVKQALTILSIKFDECEIRQAEKTLLLRNSGMVY